MGIAHIGQGGQSDALLYLPNGCSPALALAGRGIHLILSGPTTATSPALAVTAALQDKQHQLERAAAYHFVPRGKLYHITTL